MTFATLVVQLNSMRKVPNRLCAAVGDGMPIKWACVVAGHGVTMLNEWRERYPHLQERLSDACEHGTTQSIGAMIKAAGERDWRVREGLEPSGLAQVLVPVK